MRNRNYIQFRPNKYGNKKNTCLSGHLHDSKGESAYCDELRLRLKAKDIKRYDIQKNLPLIVNGKTICHHRVDFIVTLNNGKEEIHEFKGFATDVWNLKRKLTEVLYPEMEYKVVHY